MADMSHLSGVIEEDDPNNLKLVVVGDGAVGKTCMLISYARGTFPEDYVPTVFDNYVVEITVGVETLDLALWDTAGQEEYDRLRPLSYANCDVFLMAFSVVNPVSYDNIASKWHPELQHFSPNVPFMLVGTQVDLRSDPDALEELRNAGKQPVTFENGKELAKRLKATTYMECSAKTREGLKEVFDEAVKFIILRRRKKNKGRRGCTLL
eukprot:TRINITY_DN1133_c0_g1_i1.p1 TRINITY_DN1133_c0_g1~~TRINITY_DN1133_c0_g1_i1.p1  ORF type:complete len:209 (-),score=52.50 TRINITY_DN1133_c0_g1_i1:41-667(-)